MILRIMFFGIFMGIMQYPVVYDVSVDSKSAAILLVKLLIPSIYIVWKSVILCSNSNLHFGLCSARVIWRIDLVLTVRGTGVFFFCTNVRSVDTD